jgi:hypothetical protein
MIVTAKNTAVMQGHQIFFKMTDREHPPAQIQQRLAR